MRKFNNIYWRYKWNVLNNKNKKRSNTDKKIHPLHRHLAQSTKKRMVPCRAGAAATFCSAARIICTRNVLKFNYSILIRTYNCFLTKQPKIKQPQAKNSGTPHGRGLQKSHADDEAANHSHFVWTSKKSIEQAKNCYGRPFNAICLVVLWAIVETKIPIYFEFRWQDK